MKIIAIIFTRVVLAFILFNLLSFTGYAQDLPGERLEIEMSDEAELPHILSLGDQGILFLTQTPDRVNKQQARWLFFHCDTSLTKKWEETYLLSNNLYYKDYFLTDEFVYLLFAQAGSSNYTLYKLKHQEGGDVEVANIYSPLNFEVLQFKVSDDDDVYLGGQMESKPVLMHFSISERQTKVLPTVYSQNASINDIYLDDESGVVRITMTYTRRRNSYVYVKTFLPGGILANDQRLESPKHVELLSAKLISNGPDSFVAVGTYSNNLGEYPQGMYITAINGDVQTNTTLHNFTEYDNFFNHLKPAHKNRVLRKIFRRKERGKDYKIRYKFLQHELIEVGDNLLMVAEAYYPQYRSEQFTGYYVSSLSSGRIFDGYKYTHALLCMFDRKGNTIWNNSINMNDATSYELREMAHTYTVGDSVGVAFMNDKMINGLLLEKGVVSPELLTVSLKKTNERPNISEGPEDLRFNYWFNNNFFITGTQTYFPSRDRSRRKNVFFIQKLPGSPDIKQQGQTSVKQNKK
jgi:hypothetical protein